MYRYCRIFIGLFKVSAMAELEFRLNFVVKIATDVIWYAAQIVLFEILFSHTKNISGWTLDSTRVFMGILFMVDSLFMLFIENNLNQLSSKVKQGDLDLILVKPVSSQFMLSLQKMSPSYIGNLFLVLGWLMWSVTQLPQSVPWARLLILFISVPCALAITYSLRLFFAATAIIFTHSENINYVWYQLYRLGMRPDSIYPTWLRYTVWTLIPVAFIGSVPARLIIEAPNFDLILASIGVASLTLFLSTRYWRFTLRFYSSASS
jgi:ABC-2 type transport system permease protein